MTTTTEIRVTGMTCTSCAKSVEKSLTNIEGVQSVVMNLAMETATIHSDRALQEAQLESTLRAAGYGLFRAEPKERLLWGRARQEWFELSLTMSSLLITALFMLPMFWGIHTSELLPTLLTLTLSTLVVWGPGWPFHRGAVQSIRSRVPTMDLLVSIGTLSAWAYSVAVTLFPDFFLGAHPEWEGSVAIIAFVRLGKLIEHRALSDHRKVAEEFDRLLPKRAKKLTSLQSQSFESVPTEDVQIGDLVQIDIGQIVPMDGTCVQGRASVQESSFTGESIPRAIQKNDSVRAGSITLDGQIIISVTEVAEHSTLRKIFQHIKDAQSSRPKMANLVDQVSRIFIPTIFLLSLGTGLASHFLFSLTSEQSFIRALSVLVIACPCALGLAIPLAILRASTLGMRARIHFRSARALENLHQCDTYIFDKTGTLTENQPTLQNTLVTSSALSAESILMIAAELEAGNPHPYARAIVEASHQKQAGADPSKYREFQWREEAVSEAGLGVRRIDDQGREWKIGSAEFCRPAETKNTTDATPGVLLTCDGLLMAQFEIREQVRSDAPPIIQSLHRAGHETWICSGDSLDRVQLIAQATGITHVLAKQSPEDKAKFIRQLQNRGRIVAFLGDGINDGPAMHQANVSVTLGDASGLAQALSSVTLLDNRFSQIMQALQLAKDTQSIAKQNLLLTFAYNSITIAAAMSGHVNPSLAGLLMAASSLTVVFNSLRLQIRKVA